MIKLTDRLQLMADQINNNETMADIGTDHGFLPLYLWESGKSPKVIMTDISEPSLAKAKAAAGAYQFGSELDFRVGDGLKVLEKSEVDAVVIAGMGGLLIKDLLASDMDKTLSFGKYVFQPRNHCGTLRYWLVCNGFEITANRLVREGKFICEVITAKPPKVAEIGDIDVSEPLKPSWHGSWDFPESLIDTEGKLAEEYAGVKLQIEEKILDGIMKSSCPEKEQLKIVKSRIDYFTEMHMRV